VAELEAGVNWSKLVFSVGENLQAVIVAQDSRGNAPSRIIWSLLRNGTAVFNGEGAVLNYVGTQSGLYRLRGTAYCRDGNQLAFDSTAFITGSINVRHTLPVPEYGGTAVYLGAVFTQNITGAAGTATSLPYPLASATEDIILLPGTTHWMFDLDPATTTVQDEVVVRTKKGNWCLNGLGGGLTGENIGYDYGYMPTMIPAPFDQRLRLSADFFRVNGSAYNSFNTRVRIKCYRVLPGGVYSYERCAYSNYPGGEGRRTRRWAAIFTQLSVDTDVYTTLNRLGNSGSTVSYTTDGVTSVPLMTLSTSGAPHPVPGYSGLYYTDSNLYARYEAPNQPELEAKALAAIETVRPCCLSLLTFKNSKPVIGNRINRVRGKLGIYLTDGAVIQDSVVNVKIWRAGGLLSTDYAVPITATQYVNEDSTLLKVGELDVDLADYQFSETGLVIDFTVDETAVVVSPVPNPLPTPVTSPDTVYSAVYAHTVKYDGACYTNPTHVPILDDSAVVVTPVGGCHDPACGPAALYCYSALDAPAENVILPQPFGFPAPFVAFGSNPARCFTGSSVFASVSGTNIGSALYTGTSAYDLWAYSGTSLCGYSYVYDACQTAYAPCAANACSVIIVYPVSSSPHSTVEYGGRCYTFNGSTQSYGTRPVVSVASVNPVTDCHDPACVQYNASSDVVVYNDRQTGLEVPVQFPHLAFGTAHYGVIPEKVDNWASGLTAGLATLRFRQQPSVLVYTSTGTGEMMFEFNLPGRRKQIVLDRGGTETVYSPGIGGSRQIIALLPGDKVYLRIIDAYGRLPLQCHNQQVNVRFTPLPSLPRLFDTAVVSYGSASVIRALGFCAYTSEGSYAFYGTLPFSGSMTGPVNPDSIVTVTGQDGQEYGLLTARSVGDVEAVSVGVPDYAGETLTGPFTFKFYAGRGAFGAHGEMDVWLDTDGTFPAYLRAGLYDALELSGTNYRKDSAPTDTHRNSYAVVAADTVDLLQWPCVYIASDGQFLVADLVTDGIAYQSKTYTALGWPVPEFDAGLAYTILSGGAVFDTLAWADGEDDPWLSDSDGAWSS